MDKLCLEQNNFIKYVNNIVKYNKISHAYLIETDDFDYNCDIIYSFIKMILCSLGHNSSDLNCNKCNICNLVDNNSYPDLNIISPDGKFIKKGQLIDLKSEFSNKSMLDNKRIYIIKDADKLNQSSANTILKFLEEPEDNIVAILITNNRYKVIDTILSRCQILSLNTNVSNSTFDDNIYDLISYFSNTKKFFINYNYIYDNILNDKIVAKDRLIELEKFLIFYLENYSSNKENNKDLSNVSIDQILSIIGIIDKEIIKLNYNVNYKLWLDNLFVSFMEVL